MTDQELQPSEYATAMGDALGNEYLALYHDVVWLHSKWIVYRQIFADDIPGRLAILNEAAGFYFYVTQEVMWRDMLLHLARITDSPRSVGRDNLTLRRLPDLITDTTLRGAVAARLAHAIAKCESARTWRNKRLAHHDLEHALASANDPLPGVSRAAIEDALDAVRDVMNCLHLHYFAGTVAYEHTILAPRDGNALAALVAMGLEARDNRAQHKQDMVRRLEAGEPVPEGFTWE